MQRMENVYTTVVAATDKCLSESDKQKSFFSFIHFLVLVIIISLFDSIAPVGQKLIFYFRSQDDVVYRESRRGGATKGREQIVN